MKWLHVPFTAHRISGIAGMILDGVLCGDVRFGIDKKKETEEDEEEEEDDGSLKV